MPAVRRTLDEMERMAEAIANSRLFSISTKDQAFALMLLAQAEGIDEATIAQEYDIIQGRPARKTHAVLARYQDSGGSVEFLQLDDKAAIAIFKHPKYPNPEGLKIEWTMERAALIKEWNNSLKNGQGDWDFLTGKINWQNYPRAMLRARCIAEGVRATYPRAIGGLMVVEEAQDLPESRTEFKATVAAASTPVVPGPVPKAAAPQTPATPNATQGAAESAPAVVPDPPKTVATQTPEAARTGKAIDVAGSESATAAATDGELMTPNRLKQLRARMGAAGVSEDQIQAKFGKPIDQLLLSQSRDVQQFIENPKG